MIEKKPTFQGYMMTRVGIVTIIVAIASMLIITDTLKDIFPSVNSLIGISIAVIGIVASYLSYRKRIKKGVTEENEAQK